MKITKGIIYAASGLLLERQVDVAVNIQRDADAAMPKDFHHHAWANPLYQEKRRAGMSRVVEALVANARFLDSAYEATVGIARFYWRSARGGEDEARILPGAPGSEPFLHLAQSMGFQLFECYTR